MNSSRHTMQLIGSCTMLLFISIFSAGCGSSVSTDIKEIKEEQARSKQQLAELERRWEAQNSRFDMLVNGLQDSLQTWRASGKDVLASKLNNEYTLLESAELYFAINDFALTPESQHALDDIAAHMASAPTSILEIVGHTDPTGPAFFNQQLSDQRAKAAVRYMRQKFDIPMHRIYSLGVGPDDTKYTTDTPGKMNKNRRVEVRLLLIKDQDAVMP